MLAGAELMHRRLAQIETAVRRNLEVLDFSGLDALISADTDEMGAATAAAFTRRVAGRQEDLATSAKQGPLLREEWEAERKGAADPKHKGSGSAEA